ANDGRVPTWCIMRADALSGWPFPFRRHQSCGITDRHVNVVDFTDDELNQRTTKGISSQKLKVIKTASIAAPGVPVPKFRWTRTVNYWLVFDTKNNPITKRKLLKALYYNKEGKGPFVFSEDKSALAKMVTQFMDDQCPSLEKGQTFTASRK